MVATIGLQAIHHKDNRNLRKPAFTELAHCRLSKVAGALAARIEQKNGIERSRQKNGIAPMLAHRSCSRASTLNQEGKRTVTVID